MVVIDASVAAKWYLNEAYSTLALDYLRSGEELWAPDIIRIEVASALTRRVRNKQLEPLEPLAALEGCNAWHKALSLGAIKLLPQEGLISRAVDLSLGLQHPLADCLYLAAAECLDTALVTADQKFYDRAREASPSLVLLSKSTH